ncbi:MAG: carbon starvation protein A [Phycisphaeraceae bacterium]
MTTFLIAIGSGIAFIIAYHTYGRYLARKIFRLDALAVTPAIEVDDDKDYVPTSKSVVFGHHFTSIAGTGPIVGPAIAVMWGWLPALLWVVFGSILIGAVHDMGALVVSMRNRGQTVGDIAGRVLNKRVRLLFLFVLFMALTIVLAIFGLVIAAVFKQYPASIFPCLVQIPIAVGIGVWLHRKGVDLLLPSLLALGVMYLTVVFGDWGPLHAINIEMASWPVITWVVLLLLYSYVASVLPVWSLLQPRDYINSLQLITALALVVVGLGAAAFFGGAPPVEGAARPALEMAAPMLRDAPPGAPAILPFLFITIACGACSGFHCLVSSGTSSKQIKNETDAQMVGYGSMITEGFLAVIVILACVAGLGLGIPAPDPVASGFGPETDQPQAAHAMKTSYFGPDGRKRILEVFEHGDKMVERHVSGTGENELYSDSVALGTEDGVVVAGVDMKNEVLHASLVGPSAYNTRYASWGAAGGLAKTVGAFVDGSANFLKAVGIPAAVAIALMGVLVASFAGTTLDTACRLQRYVVQELASTFAPKISTTAQAAEAYEFDDNLEGANRTTGEAADRKAHAFNPLVWLTNKHGATIFAIVVAGLIAAMPNPGAALSWESSGKGGLILWPLFGATNQLLAGLAFLVVTFYLWRRKAKVWMIAIPMVFMLIMPAWAMLAELPNWISPGDGKPTNWVVVVIAIATLALEAWMLVEAFLLWPRVKGVLEPALSPYVKPGIE